MYAYEATMTESNGKRASVWATLIKVDDSGNARPVRWESLANLVPSDRNGGSPHPAREGHALHASRQVAAATVAEHRKVRADWFAQARRDLTNLPLSLTDGIDDRLARLELRHQLQAQTAQRLEELERLADVHLTEPKQVGRIRVLATADLSVQAEIDAELVSMRRVQQLLEDDGWTVADVHTESRGYDLEARRHSQVRHVEVKGVLGSAASDGIRMTGNEVLIATQHRKEYWLYVIDQCADGEGRFFGASPRSCRPLRERHDRERGVPCPGQQPQERPWEQRMTRMIERWFPCAEVSANSSAGWGSGATEIGLFPWFAKRPVAQAKAAVICSLLPWPEDQAEQQRLQALVHMAMSGRYGAWQMLHDEILKANPGGASVLDPFSGRGMIPLEAGRLGLEAHGVDYSPVAVLASTLLTGLPP
ncbi:DUF3883 domain-containing protein [Streptomyces sp. S1A(2023)]